MSEVLSHGLPLANRAVNEGLHARRALILSHASAVPEQRTPRSQYHLGPISIVLGPPTRVLKCNFSADETKAKRAGFGS